ncbi:MAG: hypothetical protein QOH01_462 [Verrucomicrobiota bacterium]|jgi:outer membrane protein OmpA-like peptidoglycan-associated protein
MKRILLLLIVALFAVPFPGAVARSGTFVTIIFASGSARLDRDGKDKLDEVGTQMIAERGLRAQITGYSKPGERIENGRRLGTSIGEARATAVKTYLVVLKGIDPARIATLGEDDSTQNRVAEVVLSEQ